MSSSKRARAREDGLGEEGGGGSGPKCVGGEGLGEEVGEVVSGELGGLGK